MKTDSPSAKTPAQSAVDAKPPDNGPHSPRAMKRLAEEKAKAIEAGAPHADIVDKAYTVTFKGSSSKVGDIEKEKELAAGKNPDETKTEKGKRTYSPEEVRSKAKAFASSGKLSPEERRVLTEILGES